MRLLRLTALVTMIVLTTQGIRHFYVRYIEPRTSVLDRFETNDTSKAIAKAASLEELVSRYAPVHEKVVALNAELEKKQADKDDPDQYQLVERKFRQAHPEYGQESQLSSAIHEWEANSAKILEVRAFWIAGALLLIPGSILLAKGPYWMGLSFLIPAVVEMLWWSSPSLTFSGCPKEFDRLLENKLLLTTITFAIVLVLWSWFEITHKGPAAGKTPKPAA
jgi:hypothetical protein